MSENYKFSQNSKCEYFPCHKVNDQSTFNCLFCFCPLYMLGKKCGGDFKYTEGVKDCSSCTITHEPGGYEYVMKFMKKVVEIGSSK